MQFTRNTACFGGGIYLDLSSELHILKLDSYQHILNLYFFSNIADCGGAIYVNDETYVEICTRPKIASAYRGGTNCFIQITSKKEITHFHTSLEFTHNIARINGSVLYGGLLDRCSLSNTAMYSALSETNSQYISGVTYFRNISNITSHDQTNVITSKAVNVCFCHPADNQPDCSYQPPVIQLKKGQQFNISLVAVDQINQTVVKGSFQTTLHHDESGLGNGQIIQSASYRCTSLTYNVYSPWPTEKLSINAISPCHRANGSTKTIFIHFLDCTCPIGFQPKQINQNVSCEYICDTQLNPYIIDPDCDSQTGILLKSGSFWISNLTANMESTRGYKYIVYPHCPFDYCLQYVHLNLNVLNGADAQCANNRSGLLCGSCKPGLSLSLGGSVCISCSKAWYKDVLIILICFFVSGILLVISILVLNLTVAVGTLNGLVFYANIIGTNTSIFFPTTNLKYVSVLLSWLNLDMEFDACFYNGMDAYWKTWLQLAFPIYIMMLVIIIIVFSDYSFKFSELLAKRNPVATLTTLILLSYTKLLRIMISSMSFAIITYPNGSHEIVWLPDASIKYLQGKHIVLFVLGTIIFFIGVVYTLLLFSWQWLLRHQNLRFLKWIGHQRLCHFIEPYHAPYTFKHRYWTGLLLLARVVLYLVFALNKSGDPGVNLISISVVSCGLMFLKGLVSRVYKSWIVEAISMTCYLNMALLSVSTLFLLEISTNQFIFAFISGTIVILLLLLVFSYHIFTEICLKVWKTLNKPSARSFDETSDLPNVSQIDFDSRDHLPVDELMPFTLDKYLGTNRQELSTLPDCGNSLQMQRDESNALMHRNSFSDDDTDSAGSVTPLLN